MLYRMGKCYPDAALVLPGEVLDRIDGAGDGEIRILLFVAGFLKTSPREEEELIALLSRKFSREEVLSALAFWRGCGILKTEGKKGSGKKREEAPVPDTPEQTETKKFLDADEAPFYTSKELADAAEAKPEFKNLVSFAEERLEKVMNTSELARLYSFLDYLKMPLDVVMLVIEDCVSREKRSLRYITKMLTSFQDEGIDTYQKAEAYFAARQETALYEKHVRKLFGLGQRKLTAAESEILATWRTKYAFGFEMLDAAYEKTVFSAKNPSIKYMHKILESWHSEGVTTPEEARKAGGGGKDAVPKSYDLDDYFQKAVSKGRKKL